MIPPTAPRQQRRHSSSSTIERECRSLLTARVARRPRLRACRSCSRPADCATRLGGRSGREAGVGVGGAPVRAGPRRRASRSLPAATGRAPRRSPSAIIAAPAVAPVRLVRRPGRRCHCDGRSICPSAMATPSSQALRRRGAPVATSRCSRRLPIGLPARPAPRRTSSASSRRSRRRTVPRSPTARRRPARRQSRRDPARAHRTPPCARRTSVPRAPADGAHAAGRTCSRPVGLGTGRRLDAPERRPGCAYRAGTARALRAAARGAAMIGMPRPRDVRRRRRCRRTRDRRPPEVTPSPTSVGSDRGRPRVARSYARRPPRSDADTRPPDSVREASRHRLDESAARSDQVARRDEGDVERGRTPPRESGARPRSGPSDGPLGARRATVAATYR